MIPKSIQLRGRLRAAIPAFMLVVLLAGMIISAFHTHHGCESLETCAICSFQSAGYITSTDGTPDSDPLDKPVLKSIITLPERVSERFYTRVFASHAPPSFC